MTSERLTTLDEFGGRKFVVPAEVIGPLGSLRTRVYFTLLVLFLALPWLKINGLQTILLDVPHRHFEIFGWLFLAHDMPLLFLILAFLALTLAFVTAVWGRVWCGWACPQTVFIDAVYRKIEIWIEGDYITRRRLRRAKLTVATLLKAVLKWAAFLLISSIFAHSFIAYFTGSDRLVQMIHGAPADNWSYFVIVTVVTLLLTFNFGWFREQFCVIMCPYGRLQSVLMDADSVTVAYDELRGEPRKGLGTGRGDCVACNRCVEVCPTAIDIRKGSQMECIGCTACIDACNTIMAKVKKAPDLIAYKSLSGKPYQIRSTRAMVCLGLALVCAAVFGFVVAQRRAYAITILRAQDTPYQLLPEQLVMNHFKAHFLNQSQSQEEFELILPPNLAAAGLKLTHSAGQETVNSGQSKESHFFLTFPPAQLSIAGQRHIELWVRELRTDTIEKEDVVILGPIHQSLKGDTNVK